MSKIDTANWKEFRLSELFGDAYRGQVKTLQTISKGETPVIAAGGYNQGVAGFYNVKSMYKNKITISCNGVGCGSSFFHNYPFNINGDAIVLIEKMEFSDLAKQFIACVINKVFTQKYSYEEKCSANKALNEKIKLPATITGEPDFEYMEEYMQKLEVSVNSSMTELQLGKNSKNHCIISNRWKKFHLYDIFKIDSGTKLDKAKMDTAIEKINFVGRSNANNGITQRVNEIENIKPYQAGNLTLALGGAYLGSCFVQEEAFYTSQNVVVLIPLIPMSFEVKQFMATAIFKESQNNYKAFIKELNAHIKRDFTIMLPIDLDGNPDYEYMENYMKTVEKRIQASMKYLSGKIAGL